MRIVDLLVIFISIERVNGYDNYPLAPNALFEPRINVTTYSGQAGLFEDVAGIRFDAHYNGAFGIAFDKLEQYAFISSNDGKRIRKLSLFTSQAGLDVTGSNIDTFVRPLTGAFSETHSWHYPMGMVVDSLNANLYVGDRHLIAKVITDNTNQNPFNELYQVLEICGSYASGNVVGNGTFSRLFEPRFIAIDNSNTYLYASETLNYQLRRVDLSSAPLYNSDIYITFGTGLETNGIVLSTAGDFIYATATSLNGLWKIPVVSSLPIQISACVFLNTPSGTNPGNTFASGQLKDGPLSTSQWFSPGAIAIDSHDNLYVMDQWQSGSSKVRLTYSQGFNSAIRRVSTTHSFVTTLAGRYCFVSGFSAANPKPSAICYSDGNSTSAGLSKWRSQSISSFIQVSKLGDKLFFTDNANSIVRSIACSSSAELSFGECLVLRSLHPMGFPIGPPSPNPVQAPSKFPSLIFPSYFPTLSTLPPIKSPSLSTCHPLSPSRSIFPSKVPSSGPICHPAVPVHSPTVTTTTTTTIPNVVCCANS